MIWLCMYVAMLSGREFFRRYSYRREDSAVDSVEAAGVTDSSLLLSSRAVLPRYGQYADMMVVGWSVNNVIPARMASPDSSCMVVVTYLPQRGPTTTSCPPGMSLRWQWFLVVVRCIPWSVAENALAHDPGPRRC